MGIGFAFMPAMSAAFASLHRDELSDATPQLNVLQRVGGSIGTAVLAVVLQRALVGAHTPSAAAAGYGTAFWWATGHHRAGRHPVRDPHASRAGRPASRGATSGRPAEEALAEAVAA